MDGEEKLGSSSGRQLMGGSQEHPESCLMTEKGLTNQTQ